MGSVRKFFVNNKLIGPPAIAVVLTWLLIVSLKSNIISPLLLEFYPTHWEDLAVSLNGHVIHFGKFLAECMQYMVLMGLIILWSSYKS
jgi:large-conductance mechanosensitive channel